MDNISQIQYMGNVVAYGISVYMEMRRHEDRTTLSYNLKLTQITSSRGFASLFDYHI